MPQSLVYAVHGFLGQASDWQSIQESIEADHVQFIAEDLFSPQSPRFESFSAYVADTIQKVLKFPQDSRKIFLGYSLGGRLGLHLLDANPQLFDHYIFLSTGPYGLLNGAAEQRIERFHSDQQWANQITDANWSLFYQKWNAQKIFEGSQQQPLRNAADYDLSKLKFALTEWSLAKQKDFSEVIRQNQSRITWVVGQKDAKYLEIAESLKQKKILLNFKRISSSHRIWSDRPEAIIELLKQCY